MAGPERKRESFLSVLLKKKEDETVFLAFLVFILNVKRRRFSKGDPRVDPTRPEGSACF